MNADSCRTGSKRVEAAGQRFCVHYANVAGRLRTVSVDRPGQCAAAPAGRTRTCELAQDAAPVRHKLVDNARHLDVWFRCTARRTFPQALNQNAPVKSNPDHTLQISFSGLSLILKLKRQLSESSSWRSISAVDADGLVDDPVVMSNLDSKSTSNINNQTNEGSDNRAKNLRAMRRLMFDVTIKCFGASAIIAVFIAATCLLAVERKKVATNWTFVEIGLTLPLWVSESFQPRYLT